MTIYLIRRYERHYVPSGHMDIHKTFKVCTYWVSSECTFYIPCVAPYDVKFVYKLYNLSYILYSNKLCTQINLYNRILLRLCLAFDITRICKRDHGRWFEFVYNLGEWNSLHRVNRPTRFHHLLHLIRTSGRRSQHEVSFGHQTGHFLVRIREKGSFAESEYFPENDSVRPDVGLRGKSPELDTFRGHPSNGQ